MPPRSSGGRTGGRPITTRAPVCNPPKSNAPAPPPAPVQTGGTIWICLLSVAMKFPSVSSTWVCLLSVTETQKCPRCLTLILA